MSKRNFILLTIVLTIVVIIVLGFLYSKKDAVPTDGGGGGTNFIARFNPFSDRSPEDPNVTPPPSSPDLPPEEGEILEVKLNKISSMPVAGFGVYKKERLKEVLTSTPTEIETSQTTPAPPSTEFVTALRSVDRATGNIYQTFADKIEERKFSTTVIPQIYEAHFGNQGTSVVMRYLQPDGQTIETFLGNLPKELLAGDTMENNEVKGSYLPTDITDLSVSPDAKKIFYMFNLGESAIGTTLNLGDNRKVQVFDSPFTEWLSQWPKNSLVTLTTKPSSNIGGYMYFIDLDRKTFTKVLGSIDGLTTQTSPNGKLVLYSGNDLSLYVYHTDTRDSSLIGVKTLPEKCVWGSLSDILYCAVPKSLNIGAYPDIWYKGGVTFNDQIWKIDLVNGNTMIIEDPFATTGEEVDGTKLALDESENYLFFVNKKDSYLWELELK